MRASRDYSRAKMGGGGIVVTPMEATYLGWDATING